MESEILAWLRRRSRGLALGLSAILAASWALDLFVKDNENTRKACVIVGLCKEPAAPAQPTAAKPASPVAHPSGGEPGARPPLASRATPSVALEGSSAARLEVQAAETIRIYFPFDQSVLTPEAYSEVLRALSILREHPEYSVVVQPFSDTEGGEDDRPPDALLLRVATHRGKAVSDALVSAGVHPSRIGVRAPRIATSDKDPMSRLALLSIGPER